MRDVYHMAHPGPLPLSLVNNDGIERTRNPVDTSGHYAMIKALLFSKRFLFKNLITVLSMCV